MFEERRRESSSGMRRRPVDRFDALRLSTATRMRANFETNLSRRQAWFRWHGVHHLLAIPRPTLRRSNPFDLLDLQELHWERVE
jgi:hypothetical protein